MVTAWERSALAEPKKALAGAAAGAAVRATGAQTEAVRAIDCMAVVGCGLGVMFNSWAR